MPIKNFTLFLITVILIAGSKIAFAQESDLSEDLTLKKLTEKITNTDNSYKIKLRLNDEKSLQYSSFLTKNYTGLRSNVISKDIDNLKPFRLSNASNPMFQKKTDIRKYFPDNYVPWETTKHFGLAAFEELLFNIAIPWAMARYLRDWDSPDAGERWPFIGCQSIWSNIQTGWNYDGDNFVTNMFSHPYGGNLFFNSGRTNGYNFWESSAFALAGSFIWETFMETNQPAINDWVNTGMNGAAFGEILYRLSTMITDNTARGSHRVWTELAAGIINPVRFFTRFVNG